MTRAIALFAGLLAAYPTVAEACSCYDAAPLVYPADGGTLAANASLVFSSSCAANFFAWPNEWTVTVDGVAAELVANDEARLAGQGYVIEPPPAVGATVEMSNCGTAEQCGDEGVDFGMRVQFTIGEADNIPPVAPSLGALDYDAAEAPLNCGEDVTPARDWSAVIDGAGGDGEPRVYVITVGPDGEEPSRAAVASLDDEPVEVVIRRFEEDAGKEVCATVRTFDLSGNEAEAVSSCSTLDDDETLDGGKGCACAADAGAGDGKWALALIVVVGLARRRSGRTRLG